MKTIHYTAGEMIHEYIDRHATRGTQVFICRRDIDCSLNNAGTASCWGDANGGVTEAPITPMNYVDVGECMACGISTEGEIECWGDEEVTTGQFDVPTEGDFVQVAIGKYHGCALERTGEITCWGGVGEGFDYGQSNAPDGHFVRIDSGPYHSLCNGHRWWCGVLGTK